MKVSIITAVFNGAAMIEHCINSVGAQTYADIEHIIVDGGSTDDTVDIINKYRNNKTKVFSGPDNGLYDAMNKGKNRASGKYAFFLNAGDTFSSTDVLRRMFTPIPLVNTIIYGNVCL